VPNGCINNLITGPKTNIFGGPAFSNQSEPIESISNSLIARKRPLLLWTTGHVHRL